MGSIGAVTGWVTGFLLGATVGGTSMADFGFAGSRGYEATGPIGAIVGAVVGALLAALMAARGSRDAESRRPTSGWGGPVTRNVAFCEKQELPVAEPLVAGETSGA